MYIGQERECDGKKRARERMKERAFGSLSLSFILSFGIHIRMKIVSLCGAIAERILTHIDIEFLSLGIKNR